jgi:hypothetical protein
MFIQLLILFMVVIFFLILLFVRGFGAAIGGPGKRRLRRNGRRQDLVIICFSTEAHAADGYGRLGRARPVDQIESTVRGARRLRQSRGRWGTTSRPRSEFCCEQGHNIVNMDITDNDEFGISRHERLLIKRDDVGPTDRCNRFVRAEERAPVAVLSGINQTREDLIGDPSSIIIADLQPGATAMY